MNASIVRTLDALEGFAPDAPIARETYSAINSILHHAGAPRLDGRRTVGEIRAHLSAQVEPIAHDPIAEAVPALRDARVLTTREVEDVISYQGQTHRVTRTVPAPECASLLVTRDDDKRCTASVERAGARCGKHSDYPTDASVLARREEVAAQKEAYRARKEAYALLADLNA